jgi:DnaJ-class molecular chaperone
VARLFGSRVSGGKFGTSRPFESRGGAGAAGGAKTASEDPYAILGVKPGATPEEIHAAYREAAQRYHPDKVSHLGEEFKEMAGRKFLEIQEAYDFLMAKRP